jgi:hypothetical protein
MSAGQTQTLGGRIPSTLVVPAKPGLAEFCMHDPPEPGAPPDVLLLATQPWPTGARLGLALRAVGFRVSIWCPYRHPLLLTHATQRHYPYATLDPLKSLQSAIIAADPHLIVPCDDLATFRLQQLAERALTHPHLDRVLAVIEQSLGPPADLNTLTVRTAVLAAAADGGVAVPSNARVAAIGDLRTWLCVNGFPAYLKADGTSGGIGVRPAHAYEQAAAAFRALNAPPRTLRALKRLAIDRDSTLLGPLVRRQRPSISVQRAVAGAEANSAIFCWRGQVLASITVQVLATRYERGPSTVVRRFRNAAMDRAAEVLASRLNLSGFYGLDFVLDEQVGIAWLLEMNSRATQIAHLALGPDHDLAAAAFAAVAGVPVHPRAVVTTAETIALFPQEWQRDPASALTPGAYYDVPWDAPALVRAYVHQRPGWRRLLTQHYWRDRRRQKRDFEASAPSETTAPRVP